MLSLNNKRNYVAVPETPSQFIPSQFSLVEGDIGVGGLLHGCNSKSSRLCKYSICSLKIEHAESLGGWHKVALEQFRNLGSALARHTGQDEGEKTGHLVKRASILLQKGLAATVLNRIPGHPNPVIDGQE